MWRVVWVAGALALGSCGGASDPDAGRAVGGRDAGVRDASEDAGATDAGAGHDGGSPRDAGSGSCAAPPSAPTTPLRPAAGELFYAQIGLGGFSLGEAALLVGPDGTVVLVDVANDSHDDDVARELLSLTGDTRVDHVVVTHFHADHGDGLTDLVERVTLTGRVVHRGFTDLTPAANEATIEALCELLTSRPGASAPLCASAEPAPCDPDAWTGTYPAVHCDALATADLALGDGARLDFVAANGFLGADRFEATVGPIDTVDSNGENARSVVGLIAHGAFRMLITGDLTGGGSDTDDVESFYAARLEAAGVSARGVDVLHAGHHGRDTSSNATWIARLLPADGRSRNAIMGISTAHLGSPHAVVLATLLDGGRLGEGRAWTTDVSAGGATATGLVDAEGGLVLLATLEGGAAYAVQAVDADGVVIESRAFRSAGACP